MRFSLKFESDFALTFLIDAEVPELKLPDVFFLWRNEIHASDGIPRTHRRQKISMTLALLKHQLIPNLCMIESVKKERRKIRTEVNFVVKIRIGNVTLRLRRTVRGNVRLVRLVQERGYTVRLLQERGDMILQKG